MKNGTQAKAHKFFFELKHTFVILLRNVGPISISINIIPNVSLNITNININIITRSPWEKLNLIIPYWNCLFSDILLGKWLFSEFGVRPFWFSHLQVKNKCRYAIGLDIFWSGSDIWPEGILKLSISAYKICLNIFFIYQ